MRFCKNSTRWSLIDKREIMLLMDPKEFLFYFKGLLMRIMVCLMEDFIKYLMKSDLK